MASQPPLDEGTGAPGDGSGSVERQCFQLRLLNGFSLEQFGVTIHTPQSVRRLIAFLGVRGRCSRAELAGTLWPDVPEAKAQASLRTVLWRLHRSTVYPLVTGQDSLALSNRVGVDVRTFVATTRSVLRDDEGRNDDAALAALTVVGELLPGWYDDWVVFERERLRQLQMHALEAIATRLIAAKRYAQAIEAAMAAVRLEPLRESANRALIIAHLAENNVVEAVRLFESFRAGLSSELGVEPTADLVRLVESSLARSGGPVRAQPQRDGELVRAQSERDGGLVRAQPHRND